MSVRIDVPDTAAMEHLGRELGERLRAGDLVVLTGPLGAGKTTLTRGIGDGLGVRGPVQSPTFVLARTHPSLVGGAPLVHVDAYRLGTATELWDLDLDFDRSVVVAEWGAGLIEDAADSRLEVVIARRIGGEADDSGPASSDRDADRADLDADLDADEPRTVTITGFGPRWAGTPYAPGA
ncbi:tRNA (adenosine(37)-N6)-threonylcarbamoyltransferase complex ATPase subunit type 1 TsaE [Agromyces intestinalis]|uniref:tRNA threonylcarbamoyladenosine biosynthesis protein TsaE n=1 Tax=Agromyces intestinalis TaxID=2592652 RepID=A0A5C1YIK3_9MICO|nr:tRNA (adenosine(37)-N6)-threonylcarbamoyltransferase complex ATPase subunit type 1 TsaE [Agromyces intestinalis]QEO15190.1 tRNA (adenosine(37)-N6)-threonylcarbamoyltransferase complex ATPase subunit type 1 TsaE [Agromyces intestinalis]